MFSEIFNATTAIVGTIIGIVSGIFGIVSYVVAERMKHDAQFKLHQYSSDLETISHMASSALWEVEVARGEHDPISVRKHELVKACLTNIRLMTAKYIDTRPSHIKDDLFVQLLERRIVWSQPQVWELEQSASVGEIWLVTPDLEPDLSDRYLAQMTNRNLQRGKHYVEFYYEDLEDAHNKIKAARKMMGISNDSKSLLYIPLSKDKYQQIAARINLYFDDKERIILPRCFEEITFTQIQTVATFWQEPSEAKTRKIWRLLEEEYRNWQAKNAQNPSA
jgi:hypothetical protein